MSDHVEVVFTIPGINIPITNVVIMTWIAMALIIVWAFASTRKLNLVPKGLQNFAEFVVEALNSFVKNLMPHNWRTYAPYIGAVGLFLAIANTIGALFMTELTHGVVSPITRTLAVPAALAIMTITIVIVSGIMHHGIIGFIKNLFKPVAIMFPFKVLEFFIKPLSLCLRLYGNIFGAYIIMELIFKNLSFVLPAVACLYFDLFDGILQAFIFILLTTLYISEEVEDEH